MSDKKRYIRISRFENNTHMGSYIQPATKKDLMNAVDGELDAMDDDQSEQFELRIETTWMTEEKYKELGEFQGW